jgi:hypothetical protein
MGKEEGTMSGNDIDPDLHQPIGQSRITSVLTK